VFVAFLILFTIWVPDTFWTTTTWRSLLQTQAITALVAVGLVLPLAAGVFDLSVGTAVGVGIMLISWVLVTKGIAVVPAVLLTVVAGIVIGLANGLLVVKARIDSFIATLGVSSVLSALILSLSGGEQIIGLGTSFQSIAGNQLFGITYPVYMLLIISFVAWYALERTPAGRRVYATGENSEAARLAGVRTSRIVVAALIVSATVAAFGGLLQASSLGTGDPTVGPDYLLPAFSAAFLGSTQFRGGRFNVWGTVVSVYVLATGVKGLQLAGAPIWLPSLFNGVALLVAVGATKYTRRSRATGRRRRIRGRSASA
jgi:ribose transport system permease protein